MIEDLKTEKPQYFDPIRKYNATVEDTLKLVAEISTRDKQQVLELAQELKADSVGLTSKNIWNFLKQNIPYKQDVQGTEQVRTPARVIADAKDGIGVDCDCMTTFVSAILKNLDIDHYYKVVAWTEDKYAHIYPVAVDQNGDEFAIDGIPEIEHFNVEMPYTAVRKFSKNYNMNLQELNGIDTQDMEQDFINTELNGNSIEEESDEALDQYYLDNYQALMGNAIIVDDKQDADMVLSGAEFFEGIYFKQLQLLRNNLRAEKKTPSILSKYQDTDKEIKIAQAILSNWDSKRLPEYIDAAIEDTKTNKAFYTALKEGIESYTRNQTLNGVEEFDIYLKMLEDEELHGMALNGGLDGWFKKAWSKVKSGIKKVGKKVGNGLKKIGKALHRGAMLPMRATLFPILRAGGGILFLARYASKEDLAKSPKLKIKKKRADFIVDKIVKALGYKTSGFDSLVKKGIKTVFGSVEKAFAKVKAGKQLFGSDGELNGELGWVAAVATAVAKLWGLIKKVFKRKPEDPKLTEDDFIQEMEKIEHIEPMEKRAPTPLKSDKNPSSPTIETTATSFNMEENKHNKNLPAKTETTIVKEDKKKDESVMDKVKAFAKEHKKKLIVIGIVIGLLIIAWIGYKIWKKRQESKKPVRRRSSNRNRALNGSSSKGSKSSGKKQGSRLKEMHKIAKKLQDKHPNTKYSTLLKRAAVQQRKAA